MTRAGCSARRAVVTWLALALGTTTALGLIPVVSTRAQDAAQTQTVAIEPESAAESAADDTGGQTEPQPADVVGDEEPASPAAPPGTDPTEASPEPEPSPDSSAQGAEAVPSPLPRTPPVVESPAPAVAEPAAPAAPVRAAARAARAASSDCIISARVLQQNADPNGNRTAPAGTTFSYNVSFQAMAISTDCLTNGQVTIDLSAWKSYQVTPVPAGAAHVEWSSFDADSGILTIDLVDLDDDVDLIETWSFSIQTPSYVPQESTLGPIVAVVTGDDIATYTSPYEIFSVVLAGGAPPTDPDIVQPAVTGTGSGSYLRDHDWSIAKSADTASATVPPGTSVPVEYTIRVRSAASDSQITAAGTVTFSNSMAVAIEGGSLTLTSAADGTCTSTVPAEDVTIPGNADLSVPFTCSYASVPSGGDTITVEYAGGSATGRDGTATASEQVDVAFTATETDKTVVVSDTAPEFATAYTTEAERTVTATQAGVDQSFTYSKQVSQTFTNTAGLSATSDQAALADSHTVTVTIEDPEEPVKDLTVGLDLAAGFDRHYRWTIAKAVDRATAEVEPSQNASFLYTVIATPDGSADSGWTLIGTASLVNPNDWPVTATVTVDDPAGASCTPADGGQVSVPAGGGAEVDVECTWTALPSDTEVGVSLTWTGSGGSGEASASADEPLEEWTIATETDKTVTVTDDQAAPGAPPLTLGWPTWNQAGTAATFSYSLGHQAPSAWESSTGYTNTAGLAETGQTDSATVTVTTPAEPVTILEGLPLTLGVDVSAALDRRYHWTIEKTVGSVLASARPGEQVGFDYTVTATPAGSTPSGWTLAGTASLANPNEWPVTATVTVDDPAGATCTPADGGQVTVPGNGSLPVQLACSWAAEPVASAVTVRLAWEDDDTHVFAVNAAAAGASPAAWAERTTDATVTVLDSLKGELGQADWAAGPEVFSYSLDHATPPGWGSSASYTNTATIAETGQANSTTVTVSTGTEPIAMLVVRHVDTDGHDLAAPVNTTAAPGSAYDTEPGEFADHALVGLAGDSAPADGTYGADGSTMTVTYVYARVGRLLTAGLDVVAGLDRLYGWSIGKTVDKPAAQAEPGGLAGFGYRVTVTPAGSIDSGWWVSGTARIANPNAWAVVAAVAVDDPAGATCTPADGGQVTVPASAEVTVEVVCSWADVPTATEIVLRVSWDGEANGTAVAEAETAAAASEWTVTSVNEAVTITDSLKGALGSAPWGEGPSVFSYSLDHAAPPGWASSAGYSNTATIMETGQTATTVVTVATPPEPGRPVATLVVEYVDADGVRLAPSVVLTGAPGASYTTRPLELDGWVLREVPSNARGVYGPDGSTTTVTYVYEPEEDVIPGDDDPGDRQTVADALPLTGVGLGTAMLALALLSAGSLAIATRARTARYHPRRGLPTT